MKIAPNFKKSVVAVSGGVDSVVLLDMLAKNKDAELFVAHFDHGIRQESHQDATFVEKLAKKYGKKFYLGHGNLGPNSSEAAAREARYKFLISVMDETGSDCIVTAHHQDDLIETAIINMLRGTTARGLGSLKSTRKIARPLLHLSKNEIIDYAESNNLQWREDETNTDTKYLRNYVRLNIIPRISEKQKVELIELIENSKKTTAEIDDILSSLNPWLLKRSNFVGLPHDVALEVVASILRKNDAKIDRKTLERLVVDLKSLSENAEITVNKKLKFRIKNGYLHLLKD